MDLQQLNLSQPADEALADAPAWRFRVSKRARNLRIQVFPHGGVEIVVPRAASKRELALFVAEHSAWITKTQQEYMHKRGGEKLLPERIELPAIDEQFLPSYFEGARPSVRENGNSLVVFAPGKAPEHIWPVLQNWLKRKARKHLSAELTHLSRETQLYPQRLQVRLQQTRWGSCSPSGTISLNAAVLLRSQEEMRYVIIHELCHLKHMNHSKRYWRLVESFEPAYKSIDRRLAGAWDSTPLWINKPF